MSLIPFGYLGWLLCVVGATLASLPQWFVVQDRLPAVTAEIVGLPILALGSILLIVSWLPEAKREYPEILETTETPVPEYYLEEAAKES